MLQALYNRLMCWMYATHTICADYEKQPESVKNDKTLTSYSKSSSSSASGYGSITAMPENPEDGKF